MAHGNNDQGWLNLFDSVVYPWLVVAAMVAAYLATSAVDADGPRTSFAIGVVGATSIAVAAVYGWWVVLVRPEVWKQRLSRRETRLWTGFSSTLMRWMRFCVGLIGWLGMIALTVLSLLSLGD